MTISQITDIAFIIFIAVVAVCQGIITAVDFFQAKSKAKLPKEVLSVYDIAKFVVSEAGTLDISGAEKKAKAVEMLLDQCRNEGKEITPGVAKGAVQHAYNEAKKADDSQNTEAKPIGFVDSDSKQGD